MRFGGYPKVVTTEDPEIKKILLKDLYDTIILKDIVKTFNINDYTAIEKLSKYFTIHAGAQITINELSKDIGIASATINKYLDAMEKSYLLRLIKPFYTNKTKELSKQPKVFFIDTGLRNAIRNNYSDDGAGFENYVLTELLKSGFDPKYWRSKTKQEVDFVIDTGTKLIPIEVKLSESTVSSSLKSFISEYKPNRVYIVTLRGEHKKNRI